MKNEIKEIIGKTLLNTVGLKNSLKLYYRIKVGLPLDLENPKRYTEKIQYRKLHYDNPIYIKCADKYTVREYVKEKIGKKYLIPLYYVDDNISISDIEKLPNSFVIKTNNASQTNIIVKNKKDIDIKFIHKKIQKFLKYKFGYRTFELFYNSIKPKVLVEKYIGTKNEPIPSDYKFHVFNNNGVQKIIVEVHKDRFKGHSISFYDEEWKPLYYDIGYNVIKASDPKPKNYKEMLDIVKKLSSDFDYIRVDLYNVEGKIYFGELTFTDGSGYEKFNPVEKDLEWGSNWNIENKKK